MTKEEVLHYFQDINYMYNDCGMQDTLSKCLDEYADEIRADAIDDFAIWCDNNGIDFSASYPSEIIAMFNEDMRNGYQIKEQTDE